MRPPPARRSPRRARTSRAARQAELTKSFASAADTAAALPAVRPGQIIAGAKTAFLQGDQWAYLAGIIAVLLGAALVFFMFPRRDDEKRLLASYAAEDAAELDRPRRGTALAAPALTGSE